MANSVMLPRLTASSRARATPPTLTVVAALIAAVVVSLMVKLAQPADAFPYWRAILAIWIAAVVAYSLAWFRPRWWRGRVDYFLALHPLESSAISLLMLSALAFRVVALGDLPRVVGGDDGQAALIARNILEGQPASPFSAVRYGLAFHPSLWFYGQAAGMWLFGDDVAGSRMFSAFIGVMAVALTYSAARAWFGVRVAFLAAIFLAVFPYHLHWSRSQLNVVGDTAAIVAVLWSLHSALSEPGWGRFALGGLAVGLAQYSYQGSRVLLVLVPALIVREVMFGRLRGRGQLMCLAPLAGGFLVAYLPMIVYYADHLSEYVGRAEQVSIFSSGWLAREAPLRGTSEVAVILDQFRRSFLVFFSEPPRAFFAPSRPLLDPLGGICLVIGVVVALARGWRSPAFDVVMCLTAIVSLQALTVDVPASARLAITGPLIAILVAVGLDCLTRRVSFGRGRLATGLAALGVAFFSITGLRFYFFEYAPIHEGTALPQTELAYLMRTYAPGTRYLLFTEPAFSCGSHATLAFIAPEQVCVDPVLDNGRITNTALQPGDIIAATANQRAVAQQFVAEGLPDYPMDPEEIAPDMGLSIWRPRGGT